MKKIISVICLLAGLSCPAFAKDAPEAILSKLPPKIGQFAADAPVSYQDKSLRPAAYRGYTVTNGAALTVYLYDLGIENIEEGIRSDIIAVAKKQKMDDARGMEEMGITRNVKMISEKELDFDIGQGKKLKVLSAINSLEVTNFRTGYPEACFSAFYITGLKGYICLISVTWPAASNKDEVDKTVKALFSGLAK